MIKGEKYILWTILMVLLVLAVSGPSFSQVKKNVPVEPLPVINDSLLETFSIEELTAYRNRYLFEIERLEQEREEIRLKGIRDGELFVKNHAESKVMDKVMMRLGDLLYEMARDRFDLRMQQYDRDVALYDRGELLEQPVEPRRDYSEALSSYEFVIRKMPLSELVDDAMYNKGFLMEELGEFDLARAVFDSIIVTFPNSRFVPDAYMRIAEYYFGPIGNDIQKSIAFYEKILDYQESPRFDEALYRLGWCYYRLNEYPRAISYFTLLADDISKSQKYDPKKKYTNPTLAAESVEYIGISFLEYGGVSGATEYLNNIGDRQYGFDILKRIGDAYMREKEEYVAAIEAYEALLKMYPMAADAPKIQNNIVLCYRRLTDDKMAYMSRERLFSRFKKSSEWWEANPDKKVREAAQVFTESALRDNISLLLQMAESLKDKDFYNTAVKDSRKYLDAFPESEHSPLIHWNLALTLDTKLGLQDSAYQEYLNMSSKYWGTQYQKYAAENAIALAKDAAAHAIVLAENQAREQRAQPMTIGDLRRAAMANGGLRDALTLKPTEFLVQEQRLAQAYDNFIQQFPQEKETAIILANAGALHYSHNYFKEALRYFNTLVKHFPNSEEVSKAQYMIMESYFGKMDYGSSEIIAKRIMVSELAAPEIKIKAERRLAESIFLSAEMMAENGAHLEAGEEYRRVVQQVPTVIFADLALFNAGIEFDKAKEFSRAIETYVMLIDNYTQSEYRLNAQNNLAIDYAEVKEFKNAAITYERLAEAQPDTAKARNALFNASVYFVKAEEWENAIRINRNFVKKFPEADEASDLAYDIAILHKRLQQPEQAAEAYVEFTILYPNSARVVEAFYRRGEYFSEIKNSEKSLAEYEHAIAESKRLASAGMDGNLYFAAEAEFAIAMLMYDEYDRINFVLPKAQMDADKLKKKDLLLNIVRRLKNTAAYKTPRIYEANYRIGATYQEFAATWARQEIAETDPTRRVVAKKEINETSVQLFERAAEQYRNTNKVLNGLVQALEKSLPARTDSLQQADSSRTAVEDSLLLVARTWINMTRNKLTQVNYDVAELGFESIQELLSAPVPQSFDNPEKVLYRSRVVKEVIKALSKKVAEKYAKNLDEAEKLGIASEWVELSRQKIITVKNIIPEQFDQIAMDCLLFYSNEINNYLSLVYGGGNPEAVMEETQKISLDAISLIDYGREFQQEAIKQYSEVLQEYKSATFDPARIQTIQDTLLSNVVQFSDQCEAMARDARKQKYKAERKFREENSLVYEDAIYVFDAAANALYKSDSVTLQMAYDYARSDSLDNIWSRNLTLRLVQFEPYKYAAELGLNVVSESFVTDSSWLMTGVYQPGWVYNQFEDNNWNRAVAGPRPNAILPFNLVTEIDTVISQVQDSSVVTLSPRVVQVPVTEGYFRFPFTIAGLPVVCTIQLSADNGYHLYLNGEYILQAESEGEKWREVKSYDLSPFLTEGKNLLALQLYDSDLSVQGVAATLTVKSVPGWYNKKEALRPELVKTETQEKLLLEQGRIP